MVDDNGYPVEPPGQARSSERIDAFQPLPRSGQPRRVGVVCPTSHGLTTLYLTSNELQRLLRSNMSNAFTDRAQKRQQVLQRNNQLHKKKMGTTGEVGRASDLPPFMRGTERIPTGLVQLDYALGGNVGTMDLGITPGTMVNLWGSNMSWKTTLKHKIEGAVQNYYDEQLRRHLSEDLGWDDEAIEEAVSAESLLALADEGYDPSWAETNGVDIERVDIANFKNAEQALQLVVDMMKLDLDNIETNFNPDEKSFMRAVAYRLLTVDSVDSMELWDDTHGARDKENVLGDNTRMGSRAQLLSQFFRVGSKLNRVPVTSLWISQKRMKMGSIAYSSGQRGNAFAHNMRCEIKMRSKKPKNGEQEVVLEFRQTQMPGGMNIRERQELSLIGTLGEGFREDVNLLHTASEVGVIKKTSWITYEPLDDPDNNISRQCSFEEYAQVLRDEGYYDEVKRRTVEALQEQGLPA
jgi:RecA/RadA recombinase